MEAVRTSETSVDNYFTRQYIPEDNSELFMMIAGKVFLQRTNKHNCNRTLTCILNASIKCILERWVRIWVCLEYTVPVCSSLLPWEKTWKCLFFVEYHDVIMSCMLLFYRTLFVCGV
jgi:hypothetical protein